MKIFISQIMKNKTDEEIINERKEIVGKLARKYSEDDITILNNFFNDPVKEGRDVNRGVFCLGKSIKELSKAHLAVFARGWEKGRGTVIEHTIAKEYGIPILEL